jgi:hypothetical protein
LLFVFSYKESRSQNLFDYQHSKAYATYLFETGQFELAAEELERVYFFNRSDDSIRNLLFHSYLLSRQMQNIFEKIEGVFPDPAMMPGKLAVDYAIALLANGYLIKAENFYKNHPNLSEKNKDYLHYNKLLLEHNWNQATSIYKENSDFILQQDRKYHEIQHQVENLKYKSPALATGFSLVIPGMGKVYSGDWKDGLISFVFVGATAIQAYRGYKQYGSRSGFFIGYVSVAASFYLGNLYGSFKSAKRHNARINESIEDTVTSALLNR